MARSAEGRATTMEEFDGAFEIMAEGDRPNHRAYQPCEGDVFITSWAKSGTTMTQQMFHQLRTGGHMDFDDISRMTPWEDTAYLCDFDMGVEQVAAPRGFKSHREYERLPEGMRYIVTLRDPKETFVSFYRFMNGWHIEPGTISMEEFFPAWLGGGPGGCDYFTHLLSWYARRKEADTLLLNYRWCVKNKRAMIEKMARFIGAELSDELAELVEHRTSREFMVEHQDKFDDLMVAKVMEAKLGIPATSDSSKVQAEGSDAKVVPEAVAAQIDAMWVEKVTPVTGHADYASLAAEIDALAAE
ncbi:sulfotransferase domain-containing protein [Altererythrobacter sp. MF3-039]|uniref:sulfotransferase domain-containing protein n=1 Tax=Altererythrobacter sp. MF3-039 TaxID=3252901 RepID=UPI00390CB50E